MAGRQDHAGTGADDEQDVIFRIPQQLAPDAPTRPALARQLASSVPIAP